MIKGAVLASVVVKMKANRNSFQEKMKTKVEAAIMPCTESGTMTWRRICRSLAPSMTAASSSSRGSWSMKAFMIHVLRETKKVA
jgi:hypothetical protein